LVMVGARRPPLTSATVMVREPMSIPRALVTTGQPFDRSAGTDPDAR
jgi:hypothetical protein